MTPDDPTAAHLDEARDTLFRELEDTLLEPGPVTDAIDGLIKAHLFTYHTKHHAHPAPAGGAPDFTRYGPGQTKREPNAETKATDEADSPGGGSHRSVADDGGAEVKRARQEAPHSRSGVEVTRPPAPEPVCPTCKDVWPMYCSNCGNRDGTRSSPASSDLLPNGLTGEVRVTTHDPVTGEPRVTPIRVAPIGITAPPASSESNCARCGHPREQHAGPFAQRRICANCTCEGYASSEPPKCECVPDGTGGTDFKDQCPIHGTELANVQVTAASYNEGFVRFRADSGAIYELKTLATERFPVGRRVALPEHCRRAYSPATSEPSEVKGERPSDEQILLRIGKLALSSDTGQYYSRQDLREAATLGAEWERSRAAQQRSPEGEAGGLSEEVGRAFFDEALAVLVEENAPNELRWKMAQRLRKLTARPGDTNAPK